MFRPFGWPCEPIAHGARIVCVKAFHHPAFYSVARGGAVAWVITKGRLMSGKIDARLQELNITLPAPPAPVASYVPYVVTGNMVFISGQVTMAADGLKYVGKVGADISLDDGKAAALLCAINLIAQVKVA